MRHYSARQRLSGGWDYTCGDRPVGYCGGWPYDRPAGPHVPTEMWEQARAKAEPCRAKYHDTPHETAEAACACYREFLLDNEARFSLREDANQQLRCAVCKAWTTGVAYVGAYRLYVLCPEHLNRAGLEQVVGPVGEAWES